MRRIRSVADIFATIARGAVIWAVAILCVLIYTAGSLRRLAIFNRDRRALHRARQRGRLLRWSFSRLGATFVKIGQVMSSRADLLAPAIIDELRGLQDHVDPFAFDKVRAIVERELHAPLDTIFRELDATPLAAGSIAQAHRGVLISGDEVAIKVLRPNITARIRRDARLLLWLAHIAYVISARARAGDVIGHTRSLIAGILAQTNLCREADNYERFSADFAGTPGLAFPRVYREYSTHALLTMNMIHGVRLEHVRPEHVEQVTRVLRETFFAMCFEHGIIHADLHPGNVLVEADGTVVLLDVGLVKHLDRETIAKLVELSRCLAVGTSQDLVAHLRAHHHHAPTTNWDAVATDASTFITELRRTPIAKLEASIVVAKLFTIARKHHIRPLPELSLVLLGMVTIEGIAKRLDPTANTLAEVARYLGSYIERRRFPRGSCELPRFSLAASVPEQRPRDDFRVSSAHEDDPVRGRNRPPRL
ncbi:MAG TPA: AarF/UbiB family protein [Kofleriaceae bacterium]